MRQFTEKIRTKSRGVGGGAPRDRVELYPSSALHPFVPSALDDHFEIHCDGPESELTLKAPLYVTFSCSSITFP